MMTDPMPGTNCVQSTSNCSPGSGSRRVAAIAIAICIVLAVAWGEVWAIEHGTELAAQCDPEYTNAFARAFDGECGATAAPIAIIH